MTRLGHKGRKALAHIATHPGCSKVEVARLIANHERGFRVHYPVISRLIKEGYVEAHRTADNAPYALYMRYAGFDRLARAMAGYYLRASLVGKDRWQVILAMPLEVLGA